jgi:hypothetical protein
MIQLKDLYKSLAHNRMVKKLTSVSSQAYLNIFHRKRIASLNIKDLIITNFDASRNVFKGFVGVPSYDDPHLMVCIKTLYIPDLNDQSFRLAQTFVERLGFSLLMVDVDEEGKTVKVMLSPGKEISEFLTTKAMDKAYPWVEELYQKIR